MWWKCDKAAQAQCSIPTRSQLVHIVPHSPSYLVFLFSSSVRLEAKMPRKKARKNEIKTRQVTNPSTSTHGHRISPSAAYLGVQSGAAIFDSPPNVFRNISSTIVHFGRAGQQGRAPTRSCEPTLTFTQLALTHTHTHTRGPRLLLFLPSVSAVLSERPVVCVYCINLLCDPETLSLR